MKLKVSSSIFLGIQYLDAATVQDSLLSPTVTTPVGARAITVTTRPVGAASVQSSVAALAGIYLIFAVADG